MIDSILGCNPNDVSQARAGAVFSEFAKNLMDSQGTNFTDAWNRAKIMHPELHARACAAPRPATLANESTAPQVPLASKSILAPKFYLAADVFDQIFEIAYRANGNQTVAINPAKIYLALITNSLKSGKNSITAARREIGDDFPLLAAAAGQTTN